MKTFDYSDSPLKVFGLPFYEEKGKLERLDDDMIKQLPNLDFFGKRCAGARVAFRTDSKNLTVSLELETLSPDVGMSRYACQSLIVQSGTHTNPKFVGRVVPCDYETKNASRDFELSGEMQDILIWFPRNEIVKNISVSVDDNAVVEAPTPYKYDRVVLYGSSITEMGHCDKTTSSYPALLSSWLDCDICDMGFSGSAHGEPEMARILAGLKMSAFIMDYDHNSELDELRERHEPFFKIIRQFQPDLPVIMLNRPLFENRADYDERREVVKTTYENAVKNGDKNVCFLDSETFIPENLRPYCTTDDTHPNDFGFYLMARGIEPTLKSILEKTKTV